MIRKVEQWSGIHIWNRINIKFNHLRGSPVAHAYQAGRMHSWVVLQKDRQTDRQSCKCTAWSQYLLCLYEEKTRDAWMVITSVSETIRKQLHYKNKIKYGEKRFSIWWIELLHPAMWYNHDIDGWLNPAVWRVALESWHWWVTEPCNVVQSWHWWVTEPCNVACGSGIMTVHSPSGSNVIHDCGMTGRWIRLVAAPCNVASGSGMTCHGIRPNIRHRIPILHLVLILTISPQSTCHFAPVCEILSKSDYPQHKKMTSCRFSRRQISAILDFRGPIMASLKSPCATSYSLPIETIALNHLVFEKIAFFLYSGNRETNRQTNRWTAPMH